MNIFDICEEALIELSRVQREELDRLGLTLADLFHDEAAEADRLFGAQGPNSTEKE